MATPIERLEPFSGFGVGFGLGAGCGVGVASGIGGAGMYPVRLSHSPSLPGSSRQRCAHAPRTIQLSVENPSLASSDAAWTRIRVLQPELFDSLRPALPRRSIQPSEVPKRRTPSSSSSSSSSPRRSRRDYSESARKLLSEALRLTSSSSPNRALKKMTSQTLPIRFSWKGKPGTTSVFVAGSFNSWGTPIPLIREEDGSNLWTRIVRLPVGVHHYRFAVDGRWSVDSARRVVTGAKGKHFLSRMLVLIYLCLDLEVAAGLYVSINTQNAYRMVSNMLCRKGVGFGYGVFLFGVGAPLFRVSKIFGFEDRRMERAYEKARLEREQGLRPPMGARGRLESDEGPDAVLDLLIRAIRERRARQSQMKSEALPPLSS